MRQGRTSDIPHLIAITLMRAAAAKNPALKIIWDELPIELIERKDNAS